MAKNKNLAGGLFAAKPTPLTPNERTVSYNVEVWLNNRNIYNDRLNCGAVVTKNGNWITLCKRGTPDRFAIVRGQIIFIEVKRFGEKPTPDQKKQHVLLRDSGAIVLVVDSFKQFADKFSAVCSEIIKAQSKELKLYD